MIIRTEFKKDVIYFTDLLRCGDLTDLSIRLSPLGYFFEIDTGEEIFRYDCVTEERVF